MPANVVEHLENGCHRRGMRRRRRPKDNDILEEII